MVKYHTVYKKKSVTWEKFTQIMEIIVYIFLFCMKYRNIIKMKKTTMKNITQTKQYSYFLHRILEFWYGSLNLGHINWAHFQSVEQDVHMLQDGIEERQVHNGSWLIQKSLEPNCFVDSGLVTSCALSLNSLKDFNEIFSVKQNEKNT